MRPERNPWDGLSAVERQRVLTMVIPYVGWLEGETKDEYEKGITKQSEKSRIRPYYQQTKAGRV